LRFDPAIYSLALPQTGNFDSSNFAAFHEIPVVYQSNSNFQPEGYISYRLVHGVAYNKAREAISKLRAQKIYAAGSMWPVRVGFEWLKNIGVLQFPEKPPLELITVTEYGGNEIWLGKRDISEKTTEFTLNGKTLATFKTGGVLRLSPIPTLFIGCVLIDNPAAWKCDAEFDRHYQAIDSMPKGVDTKLYDSPTSVVLGIKKRESFDLAKLPEQDIAPLLKKIEDYPQAEAAYAIQRNADLFKDFAGFVESTRIDVVRAGIFSEISYDGSVDPPNGMREAVLGNMQRLTPLRDAMIDRFAALMQAHIMVRNKWVELLTNGLTALPQSAFANLSDDKLGTLWKTLSADRGVDYFRYLYIRTADAGKRTLAAYEKDLLRLRHTSYFSFPILAICRIGEASPEAKTVIEGAYERSAKSDMFDGNVEENSAALVTLIKLHDDAFLKANPVKFTRPNVREWYDLILQGKAVTALGPNNCHGWDRLGPRDFQPPLRPALVWKDNEWVESQPE
jgi:hypothetical protein